MVTRDETEMHERVPYEMSFRSFTCYTGACLTSLGGGSWTMGRNENVAILSGGEGR